MPWSLAQDGKARLVSQRYERHVLAEAPYPWTLYRWHDLALSVQGNRLWASIDGQPLLDVLLDDPLEGGAIGLLVEEGRLNVDMVEVQAL